MPDAFYKYLNVSSLLNTLSLTTRKWSSPFEFNDPFDNYMDIQGLENPRSMESGMATIIWDYLNNLCFELGTLPRPMREIVTLFKTIQPRTKIELTEKLAGCYTQEHLDIMYLNFNDMIRSVLCDISIFCITERYDNLLMWAHYAENHKGGVVKLLPKKEVDSPLLVARKVNYSLSVPCLSFFDISQNTQESRGKIIDTVTLTKSQDWAYEKEWRVVSALRNPENRYEIIPFAKEELGAVYLGCRMTEENEVAISNIVKEKYPWASVYKASPKRSEFSLDFECIYSGQNI